MKARSIANHSGVVPSGVTEIMSSIDMGTEAIPRLMVG